MGDLLTNPKFDGKSLAAALSWQNWGRGRFINTWISQNYHHPPFFLQIYPNTPPWLIMIKHYRPLKLITISAKPWLLANHETLQYFLYVPSIIEDYCWLVTTTRHHSPFKSFKAISNRSCWLLLPCHEALLSIHQVSLWSLVINRNESLTITNHCDNWPLATTHD